MAGKITGRAQIRVDGRVLRTNNDATLNPGGSEREAMMGNGEVHGFQETDVAPSMSCNVYDRADLSLKELNAITDATVFFETDTGKVFILRGAFTTNTPELTASDGTVALEMSAEQCDEETG